MPTAILKAHYDGEHIVLDEPFELPANASLLVTVISPDDERSAWAALGARNLARTVRTIGGPNQHPTATIAVRMNNERKRNCGRGMGINQKRRTIPLRAVSAH